MQIVAPMPQEGGPRIPQNQIFLKKGKNHPKRKNSKNVYKYAKISDTLFDQRSLIHREAWFPGGPRIPQNPIFLKTEKIIQNAKTQKCLEICQNQRYALRPEVSNTSGSVVSTMFCKAKSAHKKNFFLRGNFKPLPNKMLKCQTTSFHYFSPRIPNL